MKRFLSILLVVCMVCTLLPVSAFAADIAYSIDNGKCTETIGWSYMSDHTLSINGTGPMHSYTYNGAPWYYYAGAIESIRISGGITLIGCYAFSDCRNLTSVTIPSSVGIIDSHAFSGCRSLTSIDIPDGVMGIGGDAFYGCASLTSINVSASNEYYRSIDGVVFSKDGKTLALYPTGKTGDYIIPDNVTSIGGYAFSNCRNLTGVDIPDTVTSIGNYAFNSCSSLASAKFEGNAPTTFGSNVFGSCADGFKILAPDNDTWKGDAYDAEAGTWNGYPIEFYHAGHVYTAVVTAPTCTEKGYTTYTCSCGDSYVADEVDALGHDFVDHECTRCDANDYVATGTCGENLTWTLDENGLLTLSGTGKMYDYYSYSPWYVNQDKIKSVVIGDGVTSIGKRAFRGCSGITGDLIIPDSVTSIGEYAFSDCSGFTGDLIIPDGVTSIGQNAFRNCSGFTGDLIISDSVTSIGNEAFHRCSSFTGSLIISDSMTKIDFGTFEDCSGFTGKLIIPDSVTSIYAGAFARCSGFTGAEFEGNAPTTNSGAFSGCADDFTICAPANNTTWTDSEAYDAEAGTWNGWPIEFYSVGPEIIASGFCGAEGDGSNAEWTLYKDGTMVISGHGAMKDYLLPRNVSFSVYELAGYYDYHKQIKKIVISEGITSLGTSAFYGCTNMESVSLPDSLTDISESAFYYCTSLKEVFIPAAVTNVGYEAFEYCPSLEKVEVEAGNANYYSEDSVLYSTDQKYICLYPAAKSDTTYTIKDGTEIVGCSAFHSNQNLQYVILPETVTIIDLYVFENSQNIKCVYLPKSLTYINIEAFCNCRSLTDVYYGGTEEQWSAVQVNMFNYTLEDATIHCEHKHDCVYTTVIEPTVNSTGLQTGTCNVCFATVTQTVPKLQIIASGECGDNLTWTLDSDGLLTISGTGAMANYYYDYAPWYSDRDKIRSVAIEDGVQNIGEDAFDNCSNLESVTISDSVSNICDWAFRECTNLTNVTIGNGVTHIGNQAFYNCSSLTNVTIPDKVTIIDGCAFEGCSSLTDITLPEKVASIGVGAFARCEKLADENGFVVVKGVLYDYLGTATDITIPAGVTSIGSYAFDCCDSLTSIDIPDSVTSIGSYAFEGCSSLTSIDIPDSVTSIGNFAFYDCSSLTSAKFEGNAPDIFGGVVFYDCANDFKIIAPDNSTWKGSAYDASAGMWKIYPIEFYNVAETVASGECGDNLTWTLDSAGVLTISGEGEMNEYGYLFAAPGYKCHTLAPWGEPDNVRYSITSVVIEPGVTSITDHAFMDCMNIESVSLPDTLTAIPGDAFRDCPLITEITIPDSVTSIGNFAFLNCTGLTGVEIPASVTNIGCAFYDCSNLMSAKFEGNAPTGFDDDVFNGCADDFTIYAPANNATWTDSEAYDAEAGTWNGYPIEFYSVVTEIIAVGECGENLTWTLDENGLLTISGEGDMPDCDIDLIEYDEAQEIFPWFEYNEAIKNVAIEDGVTSIGVGAFYNCSSLESVAIPESVTSIGAGAFGLCTSLVSIEIPDSVTSIGYSAFAGCHSLESIEVPNGVTSIGEYTFCECANLLSMTIPDSVTSIGYEAFYCCVSLKSIEIPESVTSIGEYAFGGCENLTGIEIPAGVMHMGCCTFVHCNKLETAVFKGNAPEYVEAYIFDGCAIGFTIKAPANNATWTDSELYDAGTGTWLGYPIEFYSVGPEIIASGECGENVIWTLDSEGTFTVSGTGDMYNYDVGDGLTMAPWNRYYEEIKAVEIEDGVTSVGGGAFGGCTSLTSATIPDSVTSIGGWAFYACSSLESVTIPDSVTSIGSYAFSSTPWLEAQGDFAIVNGILLKYQGTDENVVIPDNVTVICNYALSWNSSLKSVTIPDGVTSIGECAFEGCSSLESVTIPDSVTSIGSYAFFGCEKLADENGFVIVKGMLYDYVGTATDVTIPDSVTSISDYALSSSSLTNVTIPDTVTSISEGAFYYCRNLACATFEGNATETFGMHVFESCANDFRILAPAGDTTWTDSEAYDADAGTWNGYPIEFYKVIVASGKCGYNLTWTLDSEGTFTISGEGAMTNYSFTNQPLHYVYRHDVKAVAIEDSVTSIGDLAFIDYSSLTSIEIPDGVQSIGSFAFYSCSSLGSITIPGSVESIGNFAFYSCSGLGSITIPGSVEIIGAAAFYSCSGLTSVKFEGDAPTTFGHKVFINCADGFKILAPANNETWTGSAYDAEAGTWNGYPIEFYGEASENPFTDVHESSVYYDAVKWAVENGITTGFGGGYFLPDDGCTRGQVVTFLWRAAGCPEPQSSVNPFSDVSATGRTAPYYKAILWAAEQGITTGYYDGTFGAADLVTRGQFLTFLWRFEGMPETGGSVSGFADAESIATPYQHAVAWAVENGITTGYEDNTFRANDTCTRWAVVLFMYRDMA